MKIQRRLMVGFTSVIILIGILAILLVLQMNRLAYPMHRNMTTSLQALDAAEKLDQLVILLTYYDEVSTQSVRNYAFTGDKKWKRRYAETDKIKEVITEEIVGPVRKYSESFLMDISSSSLALAALEKKAIDMVDRGLAAEAIKLLESEEYENQNTIYEKALKDHVRKKGIVFRKAREGVDGTIKFFNVRAREFKTYSVVMTLSFIIVSILIAIVASIMIGRSILAPILRLEKEANAIISSDFRRGISTIADDEIGKLSLTFQKIAREARSNVDGLMLEKDITQKAEKEWKRIFDAIPEYISIHDKSMKFRKINKAFAEFLGARPEDIIGRSCYEVVHGTSKPWANCPFEIMMRTDKTSTEEIDDPKLGVHLLVTVAPIKDDSGNLIGFIQVARDINSQKIAEEKFAEAMKMKNRFISRVSNELKAPLMTIKKKLKSVTDKIDKSIGDDQKIVLSSVEDNIEKLNKLVDDVLDFQKLESGRLKLFLKECDINEVVKEVCTSLEYMAKEKKVEIRFELNETVPRILFDRNRIGQVLSNLVNNAIKFTFKGTITINTSAGEKDIVVAIRDEGLGIRDEDMPRLFNKFEQMETDEEGTTGGTGLGLAMSKEIIKSHGGKIWAESEFGKGSTFYFALPIK